MLTDSDSNKNLNPVRKKISNGVKKFKEFFKTPFSCFGIISVILFIFLFLSPFLNIIPAKESSFFLNYLSKDSSQNLTSDPFLNPANRLLPESPDFLLVEKSGLKAATPPVIISGQVLGVLIPGYEIEEEKRKITEYVVESGDTLSSLAVKFAISADTIRWANDLKNSEIKLGQKLVIPPVSGIIHHVKSGDTVSEIARNYKAKENEIVAFNNLSNENDIYIGDILVVPGGIISSVSEKSTIAQAPISSFYFIPPTKGTISQRLHWHNAVDFSNSCGALVFASAQGTVQRVSYGWNGGYGNYLTILHPNGVVTLYAHLSIISVKSGSNVSQGTIIGRVGNTGRTVGATGCHVHFEVRGGVNPFAKYPLGSRL